MDSCQCPLALLRINPHQQPIVQPGSIRLRASHLYSMLYYSFCSVLFHAILLYSILFYFVFYSILFYSTLLLFYSILLYYIYTLHTGVPVVFQVRARACFHPAGHVTCMNSASLSQAILHSLPRNPLDPEPWRILSEQQVLLGSSWHRR